MSGAPNATRMTASGLARDRELYAREARGIAHLAARFAEDVERGVAVSSAQQISEMARRLELRAAKVTAVRETADLYAADLDAEVTP